MKFNISAKIWNNFEKYFLVGGCVGLVIIAWLFDSPWASLIYALLYFSADIFMAKGKYICYIIGTVGALFYAFISYRQHYYGEIFVALGMTLPLFFFGFINWIRNTGQSVVKIRNISKKELSFLILSQAILFYPYLLVLHFFHTAELGVSSVNVAVSFMAFYLTARRSEYGFYAFIMNDLILIVLWGLPFIKGDYTLATVELSCFLLLINDIYGLFNWKKMKQLQSQR